MSSSAITISRKDVYFPANLSCTLEITNTHKTENLYFKIKTTKLKTYDVKPPIGLINPQQKKNIEFKVIENMDIAQIQEAHGKDKFKFQFLRVDPKFHPKSKNQFKEFWEREKSNAGPENYENFTFPVHFQNGESKRMMADPTEAFSPLLGKNSITKTEVKKSTTKKLFPLRSDQKDQKNDEELSKAFKNLKQKEEQLLEKRSAIFQETPNQRPQGKLKGGQIALIVLAFLISVVIGNFLKLRVFVEKEQI